jgi:thiamine transporter
MSSGRLQSWIEAAILVALALILDLLPSIRLGPWISISFAMVPVFLVAFRWGAKAGLLSGFLWGLLQVITGDFYYLQMIQIIVEYFIDFVCVGLAGLFVR